MINYVCVLPCFIFFYFFCGGENPVFCVEKASRSTLVDVVAMHKSESPSFLQTPIGFVYGEPLCYFVLDRMYMWLRWLFCVS